MNKIAELRARRDAIDAEINRLEIEQLSRVRVVHAVSASFQGVELKPCRDAEVRVWPTTGVPFLDESGNRIGTAVRSDGHRIEIKVDDPDLIGKIKSGTSDVSMGYSVQPDRPPALVTARVAQTKRYSCVLEMDGPMVVSCDGRKIRADAMKAFRIRDEIDAIDVTLDVSPDDAEFVTALVGNTVTLVNEFWTFSHMVLLNVVQVLSDGVCLATFRQASDTGLKQ